MTSVVDGKDQPAQTSGHRIQPKRIANPTAGLYYRYHNGSRSNQKQQARQQSRGMKCNRNRKVSNSSNESEDGPERQEKLAGLGLGCEQIAHQKMAVRALTHPGKVGERIVVSGQHSSKRITGRRANGGDDIRQGG